MAVSQTESLTQERYFKTTHWSVIVSARENASDAASDALEKLCQIYWPPVYYYIRHKTSSPHDAEDLTQEFFFRLLDKSYLSQVDPNKGRFRSFLLVAVNHFLANERDRARAVKRGGKLSFLSLDAIPFENKDFVGTGSAHNSPVELFERHWAMTLLARVLAQLRQEHISAGKETLFEHLKIFLTGDKQRLTYAELASTLRTTEGALKMSVQRLRQRYGELIRQEIAHTVQSKSEIDEELRHLFSVLRE